MRAVIDLRHIHYVPLGDVVTQIVFTETGAAVNSVMVGGQMILEDGRLTTIDEEKLRLRAETAVDRLRSVNAGRQAFAAKLEKAVGLFCVGLCSAPYHVHRYATE